MAKINPEITAAPLSTVGAIESPPPRAIFRRALIEPTIDTTKTHAVITVALINVNEPTTSVSTKIEDSLRVGLASALPNRASLTPKA